MENGSIKISGEEGFKADPHRDIKIRLIEITEKLVASNSSPWDERRRKNKEEDIKLLKLLKDGVKDHL